MVAGGDDAAGPEKPGRAMGSGLAGGRDGRPAVGRFLPSGGAARRPRTGAGAPRSAPRGPKERGGRRLRDGARRASRSFRPGEPAPAPVSRRSAAGVAIQRVPATIPHSPGPVPAFRDRWPLPGAGAGAGKGPGAAGGRRAGRPGPPPRALLSGILHRLDELAWRWERISIVEYLALFRDPGRLFWMNFLAGVARGLGAAVGFTLLGALVLLALQRAVELNLPYIGSLVADLLRIVRTELDGGTPGPGGAPPGP
ncbi:DUF5665 domain-containing protein [Thermaerobacter subterraneus]|uniref:Uncharacterized protein n=1 Tax=Thermaerobacter subterraneus DSM 13965 TaxID=867903 RepID=K6P4A4_9FIRM|nr:DUF5665 domain-containing protein [Thermaerobacter subterraneus]EKP95880.1 hypothetical protein ThesuDRAFT_01641 [Thermaerobacter subterraneus DSM 13965]